jgi:hypothetical protein
MLDRLMPLSALAASTVGLQCDVVACEVSAFWTSFAAVSGHR